MKEKQRKKKYVSYSTNTFYSIITPYICSSSLDEL